MSISINIHAIGISLPPFNNQKMKGSFELAGGLAIIGLSILNICHCKKDMNPVAEHPIKTVLFSRETLYNCIKHCGVRMGFSTAAIFGLGLPLCYLGMFELLHKSQV